MNSALNMRNGDGDAGSASDRARLIAANINPDTLMATDYLNHFNEIIMLLEMLSDMPDMASEILDWRPKSYQSHFEDSGFAEKDLAIQAFERADPELRRRFDGIVREIDGQLIDIQERVRAMSSDMPPRVFEEITMIVTGDLRPMIDMASALINGTEDEHQGAASDHGNAQDAIDELMAF